MRLKSLVRVSQIRHAARNYYLQYAKLCLTCMAILVFVLPLAVHAVTSISQGFLTSENLPLGSIVSLQSNAPDHVVATTTKTVDSIFGVVINNGSSLLTLSNGQNNQVQVATSGIATVLISDMNGDIAQGDQITASPISGVGMKTTNNTKVIGIAQGKPSNTSVQPYTDAQGKKQTVNLGQVDVLVNAAYYFKQPDKTIIPSAIQNLANALAGKTVSALPIIVSAAIFAVTLIVVVSMIFSMIRSSIISVGRNPLSQSAVYRDVIQLSALVIGILAVALISIYIILSRF